ncbi:hypothetical protein J5O02_01955 [Streptococcus suis]|nr:hypothetical protein [Streptococcus suis]
MKKIDNIHLVCFVQLMAIVYLVFVLLADIMKWQQLDQTRVTLAICAIAVTTGSLKKLGGRKESKVK